MITRIPRSRYAAAYTPRTASFIASSSIPIQRLSLPQGPYHKNHQFSHFSSNAIQQRHSHFTKKSSTYSPSPSASFSTSVSLSGSSSSSVNPPSSTRPAEIEFPEKPDTGSKPAPVKYYFNLARAYVKFYKTGLKNVYFNYRDCIPLRTRIGIPAYIPTSPGPEVLKKSPKLTRSDFQLLRRSAYDVRRMVPFAFILLICGEFTPLVIIAFGNRVTPLTCRVPRQIEKGREKAVESKKGALESGSGKEGKGVAMLLSSGGGGDDVGKVVKKLKGEDVLRACAVYGLSKRHYLPWFLPGPVLVESVYRPRLKRWLEYLAADDRLIVKGGGVKGLDEEEVRTAVHERGGVDVGFGMKGSEAEKVERKWLERWVKGKD